MHKVIQNRITEEKRTDFSLLSFSGHRNIARHRSFERQAIGAIREQYGVDKCRQVTQRILAPLQTGERLGKAKGGRRGEKAEGRRGKEEKGRRGEEYTVPSAQYTVRSAGTCRPFHQGEGDFPAFH